jgi:hypothetical protein
MPLIIGTDSKISVLINGTSYKVGENNLAYGFINYNGKGIFLGSDQMEQVPGFSS